jgi:hypothetical protein
MEDGGKEDGRMEDGVMEERKTRQGKMGGKTVF